MFGRKRRRDLRIGIIGAGFAGIAAAIELKRSGFDNLMVFEMSNGVGGTWWDNRYPGAEVDTPSIVYSYSFAPWRWTRTHARRDELANYLRWVVENFDISRHIRLNSAVSRVVWNPDAHKYEVFTQSGDRGQFDLVVSAVGLLNLPRVPDWEGMDVFAGDVVHSARWGADRDFSGKRVAVVGVGSTAAQLVPALADDAKEVLVFQREPGWILPKNICEFTEAEREALADPIAHRLARAMTLLKRERGQVGAAAWKPGSRMNRQAELNAREYISKVFSSRPDLMQAVTPTYPFGGKRTVLSDDYYKALLKDNVTLIPHPVMRLSENTVVDGLGEAHEVDVVALATGFHTDFSFNFEVVGRTGRALEQIWAGDPKAFLGMLVPEVPNFFIMYGPNTNGGAVVSNFEGQAKYIASAARYMHRTGATALEVRPRIADWFDGVVQARLRGTSFEVANNYFKAESGRVITQWPDGLATYLLLLKLLRHPTWRTHRQVPGSFGLEPGGLDEAVREGTE